MISSSYLITSNIGEFRTKMRRILRWRSNKHSESIGSHYSGSLAQNGRKSDSKAGTRTRRSTHRWRNQHREYAEQASQNFLDNLKQESIIRRTNGCGDIQKTSTMNLVCDARQEELRSCQKPCGRSNDIAEYRVANGSRKFNPEPKDTHYADIAW